MHGWMDKLIDARMEGMWFNEPLHFHAVEQDDDRAAFR